MRCSIHKHLQGTTVFFVLYAVVQQVLHAVTFQHERRWSDPDDASVMVNALLLEDHSTDTVNRTQPARDGMGACLMIKEDVDLLYEWIAYHHTVLPLRYLFVGSDVGNTQDPQHVLDRWETITGLDVSVVNVSDLVVAAPQVLAPATRQEAHHAFVHRQKAFVQECARRLKQKGARWTTFIDSDEFLVWNRVGTDDETEDIEDLRERKALPPVDSATTVLDYLDAQRDGNQSTCITLPRLIVGSLETKPCRNAAVTRRRATSDFRLHSLSTLRFFQHAKKGDFSSSKFGKVVMDLSRIEDELLEQKPRNIHRPYKEHCGPSVVYFPSALFYLNHYIGSWERYRSREDQRRNRGEWEQRAYFDDGVSCDKEVHRWFDRFVDRFGTSRAQYLLGVANEY